jgi:hypothetical protein
MGIIILITSWLRSKLYPLPLYDKWTSLEVINIPTARRHTSPHNSNHDGIYVRRTHHGFPAQQPPEGNQQTNFRRSKDDPALTK